MKFHVVYAIISSPYYYCCEGLIWCYVIWKTHKVNFTQFTQFKGNFSIGHWLIGNLFPSKLNLWTKQTSWNLTLSRWREKNMRNLWNAVSLLGWKCGQIEFFCLHQRNSIALTSNYSPSPQNTITILLNMHIVQRNEPHKKKPTICSPNAFTRTATKKSVFLTTTKKSLFFFK